MKKLLNVSQKSLKKKKKGSNKFEHIYSYHTKINWIEELGKDEGEQEQ